MFLYLPLEFDVLMNSFSVIFPKTKHNVSTNLKKDFMKPANDVKKLK